MTPSDKSSRPRKTAAAAQSALPNRLRIIGGRWRGRRITFPPLAALRPSPDRVRETLFNWLQPVIVNARCLDLFAGSGALGIEALSRGASHTVFVDREPRVAQHLKGTLQRLGTTDASVHIADGVEFLRRPPATRETFDVVFLDPPFAAGVLPQVIAQLAAGWLARDAFVYVECPAEGGLPPLPPGWSVHRSGRAGKVGYHLLRATTTVTSSPEA